MNISLFNSTLRVIRDCACAPANSPDTPSLFKRLEDALEFLIDQDDQAVLASLNAALVDEPASLILLHSCLRTLAGRQPIGAEGDWILLYGIPLFLKGAVTESLHVALTKFDCAETLARAVEHGYGLEEGSVRMSEYPVRLLDLEKARPFEQRVIALDIFETGRSPLLKEALLDTVERGDVWAGIVWPLVWKSGDSGVDAFDIALRSKSLKDLSVQAYKHRMDESVEQELLSVYNVPLNVHAVGPFSLNSLFSSYRLLDLQFSLRNACTYYKKELYSIQWGIRGSNVYYSLKDDAKQIFFTNELPLTPDAVTLLSRTINLVGKQLSIPVEQGA